MESWIQLQLRVARAPVPHGVRDEAERAVLTQRRLNSRTWSGLRMGSIRWTGTAQPAGFSPGFATKIWIGRSSITLSAWRVGIETVSRSRIQTHLSLLL